MKTGGIEPIPAKFAAVLDTQKDTMTKSMPENTEAMDRADVAVAQWRREMPELSEKLDAMLLLGRLSEASPLMITSWLEPEYARMGLKYGEFDVLATLVRSGPPYKLTPTELYKSTMVSSGGMTARLDKLQKAGHIERCPHPEDRRALLVCPDGKRSEYDPGLHAGLRGHAGQGSERPVEQRAGPVGGAFEETDPDGGSELRVTPEGKSMHPYDIILIISIATAVGWTASLYVEKSPLLVIAYIALSVIAAFVAVLVTEAVIEAQSKFPMIISAFLGATATVIVIRLIGWRRGLH